MKIAFISQYNPEENWGGGILRATISKIEALSELSQEVTLFCHGDKNRTYDSIKGYRVVEIKSWTWKRDPITHKALLDRFMDQGFSTRNYLSKKLKEYDPDYLITTSEGSIAKIALHFSNKQNKKIYFYPHVILSKIEQFVPKENLVGRIMSKYQLVPSTLSYINKCSGVIAINNASKLDLEKMNVKVPIKIVPNSVDYQLYSESTKKLADNPIITYVGLISERKNQKYLVRVLEKLPADIKLVLIGSDFDQAYAHELKDYINVNKLNVQIIEKASQTEICKILETTNVFVSASLLEVQSLSVLEAISSGTPVVMLENETVQDFQLVQGVKVLPIDTDPAIFAEEVGKIIQVKSEEYLQISLSLKIFAQRFSKLETAEILIKSLKD